MPTLVQRMTTLIIGNLIATIAFGVGAVAFFLKGRIGWAAFYACLALLNIVIAIQSWRARQKLKGVR